MTNQPKQYRKGQFLPGQSGNPSGRPKSDKAISELAKEHTGEALDTLVHILNSSKSNDRDRIKAAELLLAYGYGRPPQQNLNVTIPGQSYIDFLEECIRTDEEDAKQGLVIEETPSYLD